MRPLLVIQHRIRTMFSVFSPQAYGLRAPQNLVEKILRTKIWQSMYWKEHCFGLTAESLVDKAVELNHCGGTFGGQRKPTNFMCLLLKLLQLQPEKEIVVEFIKNEDYKYVRLLGEHSSRLIRDILPKNILLSKCYSSPGGKRMHRSLPNRKFAEHS